MNFESVISKSKMLKKTIREILLALHNNEVREFVKETLKENYRNLFVGHRKEAQLMIDKAFQQLLAINNEENIEYQFMENLSIIDDKIFKKNDQTFWFNKMYEYYKRYTRSNEDIKLIHRFILNKRAVDFGSGAGYFALELKKKGFEIFTTDVLDYRIADARVLPFKKMFSPIDVDSIPDNISTLIIRTVLHHIDKQYLPIVIKKLRKKVKRLIIEEDAFIIPNYIESKKKAMKTQPRLSKYLKMSRKNRLQALILFDFFGNVIAQGQPEINLPFQFKSPDYWKKILENNGYILNRAILSGFERNKLHRSCQVWMIFDRNK